MTAPRTNPRDPAFSAPVSINHDYRRLRVADAGTTANPDTEYRQAPDDTAGSEQHLRHPDRHYHGERRDYRPDHAHAPVLVTAASAPGVWFAVCRVCRAASPLADDPAEALRGFWRREHPRHAQPYLCPVPGGGSGELLQEDAS